MTVHIADTFRPGFDVELVEALLTVPNVHPGARTFTRVAPFDGLPLVDVPYSTLEDVELAFETARRAQPKWAAVDVAERKRIVLRFHDMVLDHLDEGLDLLQWETGKTRMDGFKEMVGVCTVARSYGRGARRMLASRRRLGLVPVFTDVVVERHPVGVVGVIAPWSFPLYLAMADVLPALMAGNAVVLKPDHRTSLIALWAVDLLHRAGVPRRILQVVLGEGPDVGSHIVDRADHIVFTGSSPVGASIAARCGERLVGCSMELSGKNPMIVLADADPGSAADVAIRACFDNAGQLCVAVERIYVMAGVHDAFVERFRSRIGALRMAPEVGWAADYGSLISAEQLQRTAEVVERAVAQGAQVLTGGRPLPDVGPFYYAPTVLVGVTPDMSVHNEETAGPVVSVIPVHTEEEALRLANDSPYGLNASILAGDPRRGVRLARRIRTGSVNVNEAYEATMGSTRAPVGGWGLSGIGRRNGTQGLKRFTEEQTIAVQRGLGFGTPFGMEHDDWADMLVKAYRVLKFSGLR